MKNKVSTCIILIVVVLTACGPDAEEQSNVADTGHDATDAGDMTPAEGISPRVLRTIQQLSPPGGPPTPEDETNQYSDDPRAVRLGHYLFFESSWSGDGQVSCASCHVPDTQFTDDTPVPVGGILGQRPELNKRTPTLVNVSFHRWYFWDGRADTLWGQAVHPYENPFEMAGTRLKLAHYVYDTQDVREAYEEIFGELPARASIAPFPSDGRPIESPSSAEEVAQANAWNSMDSQGQHTVNEILANVMKTIAAYQMQLVSLDSPFDQFVDQTREYPDSPENWDAMNLEARRGMRLFVEVIGCLECHNTPLFTNGKFHNIGVPATEWSDPEDVGRQAGLLQAKDDQFSSASAFSDAPDGGNAATLGALPVGRSDQGAFKTPTLRNVAERPPYMHSGQIADLKEVIEFYNSPPDEFPVIGNRHSDMRKQLNLEDEEIDQLVEFLKSLTGQPIPDTLRTQPQSPSL